MNRKLHILFLSGWYPSRVLPTNGDFVQRHAEAVATRHQVTVIHIVSDINLKKTAEFTEFTKNNVRTIIGYVPSKFKPYYFFKAYVNAIKKTGHFNLVHLNITFPIGFVALYLKWLKKKPYIISEHWTDYQYPLNKSIGLLQKTITKIIVKNASYVCAVSYHLQKAMINFGLKGNYITIPNVVNTSIFNVSKKENKSFIITHISHMGDEHKNITGILKTVSKLQTKLPNLELNLIGNDSKKYIALIKKLKIKNVRLIEQIPNIEVAKYLNESDVFILFSNYENLPCVILESFACGIPVISTNVGGINEYFPENFGYLIKPKDENALNNSIIKIYKSELASNKFEMHQYAINNFGVENISNKFSELYFKALNQ